MRSTPAGTARMSPATSPQRRRRLSFWRSFGPPIAVAPRLSTPVGLVRSSGKSVFWRFSPAAVGRIHPAKILMDAQEIAVGWWPGDANYGQAAFYSYTHPAPDGYANATLAPPSARWEPALGEYILDVDDPRATANPHEAALEFARSALRHSCEVCAWIRRYWQAPRAHRHPSADRPAPQNVSPCPARRDTASLHDQLNRTGRNPCGSGSPGRLNRFGCKHTWKDATRGVLSRDGSGSQ